MSLSKARLGRMHDVMAGYVERGDVPGIVTLVSRRGEVHVDAIGTKAVAGGEPIQRDTIFRIASLTKPIAAAATLILVEECRLRLDEPVDRLLPELAHRTVPKRLEGPLGDTVPANRPITVRYLLTFRAGYGIVMAPPDTHPIQRAMSEQRLGQGPPKPLGPVDLAPARSTYRVKEVPHVPCMPRHRGADRRRRDLGRRPRRPRRQEASRDGRRHGNGLDDAHETTRFRRG